MIQDIHPHRFDVSFRAREPKGDDFVAAFRGSQTLLAVGGDHDEIPTYAGVKDTFSDIDANLVYLFSIDERAFFLYSLPAPEEAPLGFAYRHTQAFRDYRPVWLAFAGITASHLAGWYAKNQSAAPAGHPCPTRPTSGRGSAAPAGQSSIRAFLRRSLSLWWMANEFF